MPEVQKLGDSSFYFPITKVDEEERMVWGYGTTPDRDIQGERISTDAVKKALPDYMLWRNIREMHRNSAVGVAKELNLTDDGLYVGAKIVDETAWEKVKEGVYKGFSVGGERLAKVGDTITELRMTEISLVDRPANPACRIEVFKVAEAKPESSATERIEGDDALLNDPEIRKGFMGFMRNLLKREFSEKERKHLADSGKAMPDGSFPIANESDLHNAITAHGRAKDPDAAKAHIKARAKSMGMESALPDDWKEEKKEAAASATTVEKSMGSAVSPLAGVFQSLSYIKDALMSESRWEGDPEDEAFAKRVKNLMSMVGELIVDHTHHEMKEEDEEKDAAEKNAAATVIAMADTATTIEKRASARKENLMKAANHIGKAMDAFKKAAKKHDEIEECFSKVQKDAGMPTDISSKVREMCKGAKEGMDGGMDHLDMASHYVAKASGVTDSEEGVEEEVKSVKSKDVKATKADEPTDVKKVDEPSALDKLVEQVSKLANTVEEQGKLLGKAANTSANAPQPARSIVRIGKGAVEVMDAEERRPGYDGNPANLLTGLENLPAEKQASGAIAKIFSAGGRPVNNDPTFKGSAGGKI